jgi:hypothetical protein
MLKSVHIIEEQIIFLVNLLVLIIQLKQIQIHVIVVQIHQLKTMNHKLLSDQEHQDVLIQIDVDEVVVETIVEIE